MLAMRDNVTNRVGASVDCAKNVSHDPHVTTVDVGVVRRWAQSYTRHTHKAFAGPRKLRVRRFALAHAAHYH